MGLKEKIKIGVEIEAFINEEFLNFSISPYNDGHYLKEFGNEWMAEHDSSLNCSSTIFNEYGNENIEFISKMSRNKQEFFSRLKLLKNELSKSNIIPFKNILHINHTCGCHVHFSFPQEIKGLISKKTFYPCYEKLRNYFLRAIENSKIKSKDKIIKNYFRDYAKRTTEENLFNGSRRKEFNFCSEDDGMGLEWRSPNMTGIETWEEFDEFFKIIYKSLVYFFEQTGKYEEFKNFNFLDNINQKVETKKDYSDTLEFVNKSYKEEESIKNLKLNQKISIPIKKTIKRKKAKHFINLIKRENTKEVFTQKNNLFIDENGDLISQYNHVLFGEWIGTTETKLKISDTMIKGIGWYSERDAKRKAKIKERLRQKYLMRTSRENPIIEGESEHPEQTDRPIIDNCVAEMIREHLNEGGD